MSNQLVAPPHFKWHSSTNSILQPYLGVAFSTFGHNFLDKCSSSMDERHVSQRRTTVDLDIAIWFNQTVAIAFHN